VRNPLHGVFNCLDLVKHSEDLVEAEEPLELLGEGLSRIEQVTTRLLSITRDTPVAPVPSEVGPVIEETLGLLEVRMHDRGIQLRKEIADVPRIRLDPLRLQEALFNVLDNAIAGVDGRPEPRITLRVFTVEDPFPAVQICVGDNGAGVESADLEQVFDPFFSTKPVGEGTGLGLAITKEVIDAHGGLIRFQSSPSRGTIVRVLLPLDPGGGSA
jgi:signal transduction histidine kinase